MIERLAGKVPPARSMYLRTITNLEGAPLDQGLVVFFPGDQSVTGEPLAELHLHGGRATVDVVLETLGAMPGLRQARPGEFTWRAFRNGRLNLIEVESLSDLLRAETEAQRRAALAEQGLGREVEHWRQEVLMLSALVEAALDQSDEDDVPADRERIDQLAGRLTDDIGALLARPGAERLFDGIRVVFAGPPNAGKSTLINALAQREVAIVSPVPGTTRDVIEAPVKLNGIAFVLADTAGLRADSDDAIEREGISRAERRLAEADLIVWMDEAKDPPTLDEHRLVRVFPRADAPDRRDMRSQLLRVSAVTGEGVAELTAQLTARARAMLPREGEVALTRRQRSHLTRCCDALRNFSSEPDELIAAEHLRQARRVIDELTGRAGTEDMLDALFGTFCVGK